MAEDLESITIRIEGTYKSIASVVWEDIPPLAILTGINGSGKTQLLEAIYIGLTRFMPGGPRKPTLNLRATTVGTSLKPSDVVMIGQAGTLSNLGPANIEQLRQQAHQLWDQIRRNDASKSLDLINIRNQAEEVLGKAFANIPEPEFLDFVLQNSHFLLRRDQVLTGLSQVFLTYRAASFDEWQRNADPASIRKKLGPPPWEVLNSILTEAGFPYRANTPEQLRLLETYNFKLVSQDPAFEVEPSDLSSGERVILSMVMWLYKSQHHQLLPKLLLLDEPDAHLHPSLTRQFFDAIAGVLINKYGVRVIMTTHSPSTVALAPDTSIFEMRKTSPRIVRSPSRWSTIGILTSGLVTVGPDTKYVFVEDEDDTEFMRVTREILIQRPPLSDAQSPLPASPSLVFVPASKGRPSGGKNLVREWVSLLAGNHTHGIIDGDGGNASDARLHVLRRYEVENYLLDPIVVFAFLSSQKVAPAIPDVTLDFGQERALPRKPNHELQLIADHFFSIIKPSLLAKNLLPVTVSDTPQEVHFLHGSVLHYPEWFLNNKGKKFIGAFMEHFSKSIRWDQLRLMYERIEWVPRDLLQLLSRVQNA